MLWQQIQLLLAKCGRPIKMKPPGRILYITHASPVPAKIGPSRRHYHILDQLLRFYEVHLLSLGTPEQERLFAATLGSRVSRFNFAYPRHRGAHKFLRKVWRTARRECDFVPVHEPNLRRACWELTSTDHFDAVVLSTVLLRDLPLPNGIPVVGDTHNVEFDVLNRT